MFNFSHQRSPSGEINRQSREFLVLSQRTEKKSARLLSRSKGAGDKDGNDTN